MLDTSWTVGANVSSGWRAPQVNELYADDVHHGVATYEIGDSLLTEERSTGIDANVRYAARGIEAELTAYGHWFDNYILAMPDPENPTVTYRGTFPTYRFTSLPARILGADLSLRAALTHVVSVYATASLVRGTDLEHDQPLFMMPSDRARVGVHLHMEDVITLHDPFIDVSVLGVREQTRYVPGSDYAPPPPGYVRTDVGVGATMHIADAPATFTISCQNLFNVAYRDYMNRYRYYADDPGRNIIVRFTIPF
jgi:iron complex outermembrane receptor protein